MQIWTKIAGLPLKIWQNNSSRATVSAVPGSEHNIEKTNAMPSKIVNPMVFKFKVPRYSRHPFYRVWWGMIQRCGNSNCRRFKDYGGRGIRVCKRWMTFDNFLIDMFPSYKKGLCIERKDNDGDYRPGNCIWTTWGVQNLNRRNAFLIKFAGYSANASIWSRTLGIPHQTIIRRLRRGWPVWRALGL